VLQAKLDGRLPLTSFGSNEWLPRKFSVSRNNDERERRGNILLKPSALKYLNVILQYIETALVSEILIPN
jgi:hypothetical protein